MKRVQSFEEYNQYVVKLIEPKDDKKANKDSKRFKQAVMSLGSQIYKGLKDFCLMNGLRLKDRRSQVPYQFYTYDGVMAMLWCNGNGDFYRLSFYCDLQDIITGKCKVERDADTDPVYNHYKVIPMTIGEQILQNI